MLKLTSTTKFRLSSSQSFLVRFCVKFFKRISLQHHWRFWMTSSPEKVSCHHVSSRVQIHDLWNHQHRQRSHFEVLQSDIACVRLRVQSRPWVRLSTLLDRELNDQFWIPQLELQTINLKPFNQKWIQVHLQIHLSLIVLALKAFSKRFNTSIISPISLHGSRN